MEKNFTLKIIVLIKAISISIGIAIGILIPTSLISWYLRERKYQNHLSKLKRT